MEKNKKGIMKNILIIALILLIIAIAAVGINAWAKFLTAENGTATAQVAKWSFKVVDGIAETSDVIDFAVTRTDGYKHVEEGKLAPGTYGQIDIEIDATGTETILEYVIDVALTNKPTNMKFYSDSAKTQEIEIVDGKLVRTGFMSLEDVKEIKTETIYWNWPYVTGQTAEEQDANDDIDTLDAGKTMTMAIAVTGKQLPEMIVFTIEDVTYYAEEGMTWREWVDSKYNTNGYYWRNDYLYHDEMTSFLGRVYYTKPVEKEDLIYQYDYVHTYSPGSND